MRACFSPCATHRGHSHTNTLNELADPPGRLWVINKPSIIGRAHRNMTWQLTMQDHAGSGAAACFLGESGESLLRLRHEGTAVPEPSSLSPSSAAVMSAPVAPPTRLSGAATPAGRSASRSWDAREALSHPPSV